MATSIEVSEEDGVRYLHFGSRWIQGAMRIARPNALELEYTRDMMFPLLLRGVPFPRSVLVVGLGAASVTRFLAKHRPRAAQTIVEIEPAVVAAARAHFKLPRESAHLAIEIADASDYVIESTRSFDLILVDGYDAGGRTGRLDSLPFYCNCLARLSSRGLLAANLLTRNHGAQGSLDRMRAAFDGRAVALPKCESGNVVMLAAAGEPVEVAGPELVRRARHLRTEAKLDLTPTVRRLRETLGTGGTLRL